jgi:hypothetical protein
MRLPTWRTLTVCLKWLVGDRIGQFLIAWSILAFVIRPALLAAHSGHGGPLEGLHSSMNNPLAFSRLTASAQWLSMAGLVLLVALVHLRFSQAPAASRETSGRILAFGAPAAYSVALFVGYLGFVWTPATVLTAIAHDSFIFLDAIYRIEAGQRPHVDFHTALGSATMYLPALGAWLAGGFAGSVELSSALVGLAAALACSHAGFRRLPSGATAALAVVAFMIATPAALLGWGQGATNTFVGDEAIALSDGSSYAMFYNRWAWALILPVFVYLIPDRRVQLDGAQLRSGVRLDECLLMAVLLTVLFYTKATYFVAGAGAAVVYALGQSSPIKTLGVGAAAVTVLILAIGAPTGILLPYIGDILFAAQVSGTKFDTLLMVLLGDAHLIVFAASPLLVASALGRASARDWMVSGYILAASLYMIIQNAQTEQMVTLSALAAYGLSRALTDPLALARALAISAFALTVAWPVVDRSAALMQQVAGTRREEIREPAPWSGIAALRNVYLPERENMLAPLKEAKSSKDLLDEFHYANRFGRKESLRVGEYMAGIMAGMDELKAVMRPGDSVAQLDIAGPLPFLLQARPALGSYITLHAGRTVDDAHHPDPAKLFADTDHVMIPRTAMIQETPALMLTLYDAWLTANYEERVVTDYWIRYSRRKT